MRSQKQHIELLYACSYSGDATYFSQHLFAQALLAIHGYMYTFQVN